MPIPKNKKGDPKDYEKVPVGNFVNAEILEVKYEENHPFIYKGETKITEGVRLVFKIDGCQFTHGTRWMKLNYSTKANLWKDFIVNLVEDPEEYMEWDVDNLKGMKVKMYWVDDGDYQKIKLIEPIDGKKLKWSKPEPKVEPTVDEDEEHEPTEVNE